MIFDTATGRLCGDSDGLGGDDQVLIVTLRNIGSNLQEAISSSFEGPPIASHEAGFCRFHRRKADDWLSRRYRYFLK